MTPANGSHTPPPSYPGEFSLQAIEVGRRGRVLAVRGELDAGTAPALRRSLNAALDEGVTRLVLDLERVGFVDSVALAVLVAAQRRLGEEGRLAVVARDPYVLLILRATGLGHVLALFETRAAALDHAGLAPL